MFNDYQHLQQFKLDTREHQRQAKSTRDNHKNSRKRKVKQR